MNHLWIRIMGEYWVCLYYYCSYTELWGSINFVLCRIMGEYWLCSYV